MATNFATRLDPLECAGIRLDAAIAHFDNVSSRLRAGIMAEFEESRFGMAEDEFASAQQAYRDVLHELTGADPDGILRRLAR